MTVAARAFALLALCLAPLAAEAQGRGQQTRCEFTSERFRTDSTAAGSVIFLAGNVVIRCPARRITVRGDSAERYPDRDFVIGHAVYDEPRLHVESDFLNHFTADERVVAVGNVRATLPNGSTLVGPIAEYGELSKPLDAPVPVDHTRALRGGLLLLSGLVKVFVFAYLLSWSGDVFALYADNPAWRLWVALAAFAVFFYVNFAGYSDLAIGAGHLLGADLRPNFANPYGQTNPSAFWNSWHISLTRFLRANVFTPLVAGRPQRQYPATLLLMVLIGLWHSVTWASLAFGVYHGVSLIVHRIVERRRRPSTAPALRYLKPVAVFVWWALSLPLLQLGLGSALDFYAALVGVKP